MEPEILPPANDTATDTPETPEETVVEPEDAGDDEEKKRPVGRPKEAGRLQVLINQMKETNMTNAQLQKRLDEVEALYKSTKSEEIKEDIEEWWLEAFPDSEGSNLSAKTYKKLNELIEKKAQKTIEKFLKDLSEKTDQEKQAEYQHELSLQKEYAELIDEGMDRFSESEIRAHAGKLRAAKAEKRGVDIREIPIPPFEFVYKDLDALKPKPNRKAEAAVFDKTDDGKSKDKAVSMKDVAKMSWW